MARDTSSSVNLNLKLKRIGTDIHSPCYLLHMHDVNVLLDCCIDTSVVSCFLPDHQLSCPGCSDLPNFTTNDLVKQIDDYGFLNTRLQFCVMNKTEFSSIIWDTIDVILVSNTRSLLGLPFICGGTEFRGRILTTEPVVKFGKILMEDILDSLEQLPSLKGDLGQLDPKTKGLPPFITELLCGREKIWKDFYSRKTIASTLDKIQMVAYHEPVDIFGLLTIRGASAGFEIGSCNWTLTSKTEKVAYISHTSLLYSHVLPFQDSVFADSDVLIVGTVSLLANAQLEKIVNDFRYIVQQTLARGGHVLVPTHPCGILFDLLETAIHAKENFNGTISHLFSREKMDCTTNGSQVNATVRTVASELPESANLTNGGDRFFSQMGGSSLAGRVARIPILAVSSQINVSLAYANAYGEWLNPEKESLLYSADAPFPFQSLLRSGQLIQLKSLHETPAAKDLSNQTLCGATSENVPNSPLLLGPSARSGDLLTGTNNEIATSNANTLDPTMMALVTPGSRDRQGGLVGGVWPGSPSVIFASHPSLRFGPVVHLIRALTYGGIRAGSRTAQTTSPPRNSIILVESGEYCYRSRNDLNPTDSITDYVRQLLYPYIRCKDSSLAVSNVYGRLDLSTSSSGIASFDLSDTATAFWLPMESHVGPEQLPLLLSRCGPPRVALILPEEVCGRLPDNFASGPYAVHFISRGHKLIVPFLGPRFQPVRLSAKLLDHIRPVHVEDSKVIRQQGIVDKDKNSGQIRSDTGSSSTERSVGESLASQNKSGGKRTTTSDVSDSENTVKSAKVPKDSTGHSYLALLNGCLSTRDGKHWLSDPSERASSDPDSLTNVKPQRPSTPPIPPVSTVPSGSDNCTDGRHFVHRNDKLEPEKLDLSARDGRVFVSHSPRIDPFRLIQELTERGVTGAYLTDQSTSLEMVQRFSLLDPISTTRRPLPTDYFILFPNPNTVIRISDNESHILAVDESTRTTIRDTILACLCQLDAQKKTCV
ncbi:unnamed protein product [Calicophoron daubneyi]|uniref:Metallo-beta-lactamase domain-containing protein n=1 Tax=Calicophoron daubneyi TaxID=300641 RepID=A0AAV2TBF5_CALDB